MIIKISILSLFISIASAAIMREELPVVPGCEQKDCYVEMLGKTIPLGAVETPIGNCIRITCSSYLIEYATCGTVSAAPPCYTTDEDLSLPYPDCCSQIKCDDTVLENKLE